MSKTEKAKITKEEATNLLEMLRQLMDAYGFFAVNLGKIQKSQEEAFESMFSLDVVTKLPEMANRVTMDQPEIGKLFTTILIRMSSLLPKVRTLMDLSAEDKIKLGKSLQTLAQEINKLREHVEKL